MSNGLIILLIFAIICLSLLIFLVQALAVFGILLIGKRNRMKKKETYLGKTRGTITRIVDKGIEHPWVIHVQYEVDGIMYEIKETAKMKSKAIKVAGIPVGQRKSFVLGAVREGDLLEIRYDLQHPEKAIIYGNDGMMTQ